MCAKVKTRVIILKTKINHEEQSRTWDDCFCEVQREEDNTVATAREITLKAIHFPCDGLHQVHISSHYFICLESKLLGKAFFCKLNCAQLTIPLIAVGLSKSSFKLIWKFVMLTWSVHCENLSSNYLQESERTVEIKFSRVIVCILSISRYDVRCKAKQCFHLRVNNLSSPTTKSHKSLNPCIVIYVKILHVLGK